MCKGRVVGLVEEQRAEENCVLGDEKVGRITTRQARPCFVRRKGRYGGMVEDRVRKKKSPSFDKTPVLAIDGAPSGAPNIWNLNRRHRLPR